MTFKSMIWMAVAGLQFSASHTPGISHKVFVQPPLDCSSEVYPSNGIRGPVKTSVAEASMESFPNLLEFMATLPTPYYMRNQSALVENKRSTTRVEEEQRNVTIETCYIHFMIREKDNDYHLIVGDNADREKSKFFNVEVSGLPASSSSPGYTQLANARKAFQNRFGTYCKSYYDREMKPVKVRISGSLFYDIGHGDSVIGPKGYRPTSAWEIHPVTALEFF
jgi:hypothetical protein